MDLTATIDDLRREKEKLERVIASLEELQSAVTATPVQKRRPGRKSMGAAERGRVSTRMKLYWAARRAKRSENH